MVNGELINHAHVNYESSRNTECEKINDPRD